MSSFHGSSSTYDFILNHRLLFLFFLTSLLLFGCVQLALRIFRMLFITLFIFEFSRSFLQTEGAGVNRRSQRASSLRLVSSNVKKGHIGCTAPCRTTGVLNSFPTYPSLSCRLFSHVDDPFLDDPLPREFVLYLRPSGPLQNQLSHFWQQSRVTCGKNKAHNIFPHITLCQFFMVSRGGGGPSKPPGS